MYSETVRVLASIDVLGCEAVKLVRGVPGTGLRLGDPFHVAERLHWLGASWLHVVDLDGAMRGKPSPCVISLVRRITSELGVMVQVGGGVRSLEAAEEVAAAGAQRIVVGSKWLRDPCFLEELVERLGVGRVVAAVEERLDALPAVHGWREASPVTVVEAVERAVSARGIWGILYTQVFHEGEQRGVDVERARRIAEAVSSVGLQFSGGIRDTRDLDILAALGYRLAVVGMALHTWTLNPIGALA